MSNRLTNRAAIPHRLTKMLVVVAMLLLLLPQAMLGQGADGPVLWLTLDEAVNAMIIGASGIAGANDACAGNACPTTGVTEREPSAPQAQAGNPLYHKP